VPALRRLFSAYRTICFDSFFDKELPFDIHIGPGFDGITADQSSLSGLRYFVFPQELTDAAPRKEAWKELRNVLVTLGGVDPFQASPVVLRALCGAFPGLHFT